MNRKLNEIIHFNFLHLKKFLFEILNNIFVAQNHRVARFLLYNIVWKLHTTFLTFGALLFFLLTAISLTQDA
jgi:hypothetical protein